MRNCVIYTLIMIMCASCFNGIPIDKDALSAYSEVCGLYPEELVNHLPGLLDGKVKRLELHSPTGKYLNYIHIVMSFSKEQVDSIENYAKIRAVQCYHFYDSCSFVVDYDPKLYEKAPFKLHQCSCVENLLPITNFGFCTKSNLFPWFYKNAAIYVIGAEQGKFLNDDALSIDGVGLTEEWRNGYTRGMAISGKTVAYWLEVW